MNVDYLKQNLLSWDFVDSIGWKKQRCASKSQRKAIKRIYRYYKRVSKRKERKLIQIELQKLKENQ